MAQKATKPNLILSRLTSADLRLLQPQLEPVELPLRKVLEQRGKVIKTIYFPESGFASVVANGDERPIEVGLIGREGMTGIAVVLGHDRNSNEVYMQAPGQGHCIPVNDCARRSIKASGFIDHSFGTPMPSLNKPHGPPSPTDAARSKNAWPVGCLWPTTGSMALSCP